MLARALLALALAAALAAPAAAQAAAPSFRYETPRGWQRQDAGGTPVFFSGEGAAMHELVFQGVPTRVDLATYTADTMKNAVLHGETVTDDGAARSCGDHPARRFTTHSTADGRAAVTHYLITAVYGGMGAAIYTHAAASDARADALDDMATLCPGAPPPVFPRGWARAETVFPAPEAAISPDGLSRFSSSAVPVEADMLTVYAQHHAIAGTTASDRSEPCMDGTVRLREIHTVAAIDDVADAYLHGLAYRTVYERPAAQAADTAAERALTAFCHPPDPNADRPA